MNQGDLHWVDLGNAIGSGPSGSRPCVIIQNDFFNRSRIRTVIVCLITSQPERAKSPGNVQLDPGEGDLPKLSIVNVSQCFTLDKNAIGEYIGTLGNQRIDQIVEGVNLFIQPREYALAR